MGNINTSHLSGNNFSALEDRLGNRRAEIVVNVLEFLQQLRKSVHVIRLQHSICRV